MNTFFTFVIMTIMMMLVTYVTMLEVKMGRVLSEHLNLFDGMHEGLIVLSQTDFNIQFASKPAIYMLKQIPPTGYANTETGGLRIELEDLSKPLFEPTTVSLND